MSSPQPGDRRFESASSGGEPGANFEIGAPPCGSIGTELEVRIHLPPAESRCKPGFLSVLPRTKGQALHDGPVPKAVDPSATRRDNTISSSGPMPSGFELPPASSTAAARIAAFES
jgi:hypothetical protein